MLREQKEEIVKQVRADLERASGVLLVDFTGLKVNKATELRRKLSAAAIHYQVVKNTLMARALAGTPYEEASKLLKGAPTGVVFGFDDPVTAAKLTYAFAKDCPQIRVKGALVDQKVITPTQAEALSKMPSRTEILGGLLGQVLGPAGTLLAQLKGPAGRIVGALDKKAEDADEAA